MPSLGDRIGDWDDKNVVYSRSSPEKGVRWRLAGVSLAVGRVAAIATILAVRVFIRGDGAYVVVMGLLVLYLVAYVVWRRRRNRRLAGSSANWPST